MEGLVQQLTQLACTSCGLPGIMPRTETYVDRYAQETITEATWTCHRCGSRFSSGIVSRVSNNEKAKE